MNYLTELMRTKNLTVLDVAKLSGLSATNIRRLTTLDSLEFTYKKTQIALSKALGITPFELVKGGESMKEKLLYTEVKHAVEVLSRALRRYSDDQHYVSIAIFTNDTDSMSDEYPDEIPDTYIINVTRANDEESVDLPVIPIMSESGRIYYWTDDDREGIRRVIPYKTTEGDKA